MTPREAIEDVLEAHGLSQSPAELHSWRCDHPDRFGPCTCYEDLVDALLFALHKDGWDDDM